MQFDDDDDRQIIYAFLENLIGLQHHDKLMELSSAKTAKKNLTQRGRKRTARITLPPDVAALYVDHDGNAVFNSEILDECSEQSHCSSVSVRSGETSHSPITPQGTTKTKSSLSTIMKDVVILKFGSKSLHAESWITILASECRRLEVSENRYWEVIRLLVEKSAEEWYKTTCTWL